MTNFESKFNNAKLKMINGMIEALKYKDILDISVKELCIISGVNRTTFYAHYNNIMELLEDTKDYMFQKFMSTFKETSFEKIKNGEKNSDLISEEYLIPYLKFIKEHRWFYIVIYKHNLFLDKDEPFYQLIESISKPISRAKGSLDEVAVIYSTRFFVDGINSVVREWIKRGFKESEEYICKIILSASSKGRI